MSKRIFIANDISFETKQIVSNYIETLKREFYNLKVSWEVSEKLHITLKFLGDIETEKIENLLNAVESTAKKISKFTLQIGENGVFPNPKRARILWIGLEDENKSLSKINSYLENECGKIGFKGEKRKFHPHLTVARLREPEKSFELVKEHLQTKIEPVKFEVSAITVYESKLRPTGSVYIPVKKFLLS